MAILTRIAKGSELLTSELDNNFSELDARTAIKWQNLRGDMIAEGIANAPPLRLFNSTLYMRAFSATVEQELSAIFHLPKDYQPGTIMYPHGHICTPTNSTGVVRWGYVVSWANEFEAGSGTPISSQIFSTPVTVYVEQTVVATDQNAHIVAETGTPFNIAAIEPDAVILMRIFRDATHVNDTYPDEIYLPMVDVYYQSQGFGEATR